MGALCSRKPPLLILEKNNSLLTSSAALCNLQHFFLIPSLCSNYMKQGPLLFPAYTKGSLQAMVACNHNPKRIRRLRLACATWRNPVTKEPNRSGLNPLQRLHRVSSTIHKLIALSPPALIGKLRLKAVNVPSFHRGQKLLPGSNPAFYCLHLRVPSKEEDLPTVSESQGASPSGNPYFIPALDRLPSQACPF